MIVVATTLASYVCDDPDTSEAWLYTAEQIAKSHDDDVLFFAAIEVDGRGIAPFASLLKRLRGFGDEGGWYWTFSFDDHAETITTQNRLRRIVMGQNMCNEYAMSVGASHLLFCAADCCPPPDVLPKLLEMNHPLCAPETPTYCLHGETPMVPVTPHESLLPMDRPMQPRYPFPVEEHMASAACILLGREVFRQIRWRVDQDEGLTDDPCLHRDALEYLDIPTYVRKDIEAKHYPETIPRIEDRHSAEARRIQR